MNTHSSAAVCWICLEGGPDEKGDQLVRDCACRGSDAGFAHTSCIIKYATRKSKEAADSDEFIAPWETCPNCNQNYQNLILRHLADAFVQFAERNCGYPGKELTDKMKNMQALRLQIKSRKDVLARNKNVHLIHKLLALVSQAKEEHGMETWAHMAPTTDEFQQYEFIVSTFESYGYLWLGNINASDQTEESANIAIRYYEKARDIFKSVGATDRTKLVDDSIDRARSFFQGDEKIHFQKSKEIYDHNLQFFGEKSEQTIKAGISYVMSLQRAKCSIEAERLATKLTAICRRVFGEAHALTIDCDTVLNECKQRRIRLIDGKTFRDHQYAALRYENDGDICVVTGPLAFPKQDVDGEEQTFSIDSASIHPWIGCPVVCHGLINAPHLNGKLGDVRSVAKHRNGEIRCGVHFEDNNLEPAAVKPGNLRIAFDLPVLQSDNVNK